ncbi:MAG: hypothetical protein WDW36_000843 [Sanguina aurantia]
MDGQAAEQKVAEMSLEDQLARLPQDLLIRIFVHKICSGGGGNAIVNRALLALRLLSKGLKVASDSARTSITLESCHLRDAASLLRKLTHLTAITVRGSAAQADPLHDLSPLPTTHPGLASLTINSGGGHSMNVRDIHALLQPWRHSLTHLDVHCCPFVPAVGEPLGPDDSTHYTTPIGHWSPDLPHLTSLALRYGHLKSLDLSGCPRLTELRLEANSLTRLTPSGMERLHTVSCTDEGALQTLDLSGCSALQTLDCCDNASLGALDLSGCTALTRLKLWSNHRLPGLDLTSCVSLESLSCQQSHALTRLDLRGCGQLQSVRCRRNPSLGVLQLPAAGRLRQLSCRTDGIVALELSACLALQELDVSCQWAMTGLDVSGLRALRDLHCSGNCVMGSVVMAGCTRLGAVTCTGNGVLEAVEVSGCRALRRMVCRDNAKLTVLDLSHCRLLGCLDTRGCEQLAAVDVSCCPELRHVDGKVVGTGGADKRACCIS